MYFNFSRATKNPRVHPRRPACEIENIKRQNTSLNQISGPTSDVNLIQRLGCILSDGQEMGHATWEYLCRKALYCFEKNLSI